MACGARGANIKFGGNSRSPPPPPAGFTMSWYRIIGAHGSQHVVDGRVGKRATSYAFAQPTWHAVNDTWQLREGVHLPPPRRVFSVFGAESSGTQLVSRLIAHAANVAKYGDWMGDVAVRNEHTEVNHISLPWGGTCELVSEDGRSDLA